MALLSMWPRAAKLVLSGDQREPETHSRACALPAVFTAFSKGKKEPCGWNLKGGFPAQWTIW